MPPKPTQEALLLIINIGRTSCDTVVDPTFLEKAKEVAKRKIEKMIFLRPKDDVAIMLMGSTTTKNSLNAEHVEEFTDFQFPNWDFIETVMALRRTKRCSNWVEALQAGVKFMKNNIINCAVRKIVLMSDFNEREDIISQFEADKIASTLSKWNINLITIAEESFDTRPVVLMKSSEKLLRTVHLKIKGHHISFDSALSGLKFYSPLPKRPTPAYFTLELVDKNIPIANYVKINNTKIPTWKKAKRTQQVRSVTQYLDNERNIYEKDEIVTGYKYGETFIPVEKELEEAMRYKGGMKSYKICSFTNRNNINLEYLYESGVHVVLPSSSVDSVTKLFYSLVKAMHETNSVAIARKLYCNNYSPKMVALFPCIDIPDEPWCLVEVALTFPEDQRIMDSRPMKSVIKQLTTEQNEAVDNLLDSLMLPDTQDSHEVDGAQCFLPGCVPDPAVQHMWHMFSYRALHPDKPLPPMENYLKEILEAPSIKEKSKFNLQQIAKLFRLESIDEKAQQKEESKEEDKLPVDVNADIKESVKTEDKIDAENDSYKDSALSMDFSDADFDEMAANI